MKKTLLFAFAVAFIAALGTAQAEVTKKVQKTFRGQILITDAPLPTGGATDAETISAFKKARAKSLKHVESNGVAEWSFLFTAFLKKPPKVTSMSVDFYTADREKLYVANKRLLGIDPKVPILSGSLSISEDDGLVRGRTYMVKLTGSVRGKEVVFAETKVKMN
ncbi:MAG: hypothetical protein MJE77_03520 [Proteobacteria bacterium]|nr:hypothetical protein [Pseudomonadota bacterium]